MADITTKMSVTGLSQYRASFQQAQASVKTLDAELKRNEAQYKATGDKEKYLEERMKLLKQQLDAQKKAAAEAEKALKQMKDQGVDQSSKAYQDFQTKLANAQAAMYTTTAAINTLGTGAEAASQKTGKLSDSINSISKNVSLDAAIKGIDRITSAMESAASKAIQLGENIWSSITDTAAMADDIATLADQLGLTITEVQQMQYVSHEFEATPEAIGKAWRKVSLSMRSDSEDIKKAYETIGVSREKVIGQGKYGAITELKNYKDLFWEIGEAIANMDESADKEYLANQLLGRSWREFQPLFKKGREAYEEALAGVDTATTDAVLNTADLNDAIQQLEDSFNFFKIQVLGDIAPELKTIVKTVEDLLTSITDYLKTDEGQELLHSMANAIGALFDELTKIDPEEAAKTLANVFTSVKDALLWITNNSQGVVTALEFIIGGWATLKLSGGALKVLELVNGIKGLKNTRSVQLPDITGDGGSGTTGQENVTSQNVTTQEVSSANVSNETVTSQQVSTSNVTTMYVQNMVGGNGSVPGTGGGNNSGGGYTPPINIAGGNPSGGLYLYGGGGSGGSGANLTGEAQRLLGSGDTNVQVGGDNSPIYLQPDEYDINGMNPATERVPTTPVVDTSIGPNTTFFGADIGMAGGFAINELLGLMYGPKYINPENPFQISTTEKTGWVLDTSEKPNTTEEIFRGLVQTTVGMVNTFNEAGKKAETVFSVAGTVLDEYMVDPLIEMWEDSKKSFEISWKIIKGMAETGVKEIGKWLDETFGKERDIPIGIKPTGGGVSSWPYSYGGGMGANYSFGLGDHLLNHWGYANGLPFVPYDGYPAILHKGERVQTAREVAASRNFSSNLYVESMYMNNGQDTEGLAAAMAAAQRRTMSGYGS